MITNYYSKLLEYSSDRSIVIVATLRLEELLQEILQKKFISKNSSALFGSNGILSAFYSKCEVAYSLGLISNQEYKFLKIVRKIRNLCAHTINEENESDIEITNKQILDLLKESMPLSAINKLDKKTKKEYLRVRSNIDRTTGFLYFVTITKYIEESLRIRLVKIRKLKSPISFKLKTVQEIFTDEELSKIVKKVLHKL